MDLNKTNLTLDLLNNSKRTQYLTRLQTTPQVLSGYTVASHQHQCAMLYITLVTVLQIKPEANIFIALLTHDNMETFTGDLLAPAKNKEEKAWKKLEAHIQCDFINGLTPNKEHNSYIAAVVATLFPIEQDIEEGLTSYAKYLLVKMIDLAELLLRCADEYECGNHSERITNCSSNCVQWVKDLIELFSYSYKDYEEEWLLDYRKIIELLWSVLAVRLTDVGLSIE